MLTRIFRSGNSLAIRIPKELATFSPSQDVEIEKIGDSLVIRPLRQDTLEDVLDLFAAFTPDCMSQGREFVDDTDRNWSTVQSDDAP